MIARTGHFLLRLGAGLGAGAVVLAALLALRLERGPVSVDFLAPSLAAALGGGDSGVSIAVDHASLGFDTGPKLALLASGVHLKSILGGSTLTLPELAVDLSLPALLRGVVAPTRIALTEPVLHVERAADGSFHLGFGTNDAGASVDWLQQMLHDLAGPPDANKSFGELREVAVERARLVVDDRSIGAVWRADDVALHLRRDGNGLRGEIRFAVALGGRLTNLAGAVLYRRQEGRLTASLSFDRLRLADWATAAPRLAPLAAFDLPLSGTVRAVFDPARSAIATASADLVLGQGVLRQDGLPGGTLSIAGGALAASYDPAAGRVALKHVSLDLGGPQLEVSGTLDGVGADLLAGVLPQTLDASLALALRDLPANDFPRYWPEKIGPVTRGWVLGHVHDGTINRIDAQLHGRIDLTGTAPRPVAVEQLSGTASYRGLAINYFKPLPPARDIDGTAVFDRANLDFTPTAGSLLGMRLSQGAVRLYRLDTNDEQAAIDLRVRGPLKDALEVLDHEPLHYAQALSIDPRRVAGNFDAEVTFDLPLVHTLQFSQVVFGAKATLAGVIVGDALFGHDLDDGQFKLQLDPNAMRLDGTAAIAGVPVSFDWTQSLKAADPVRTRYTLRGQIDDAQRRSLGLDYFPERLSGPVGFDLDYALAPSGAAQAKLNLDLGAARLDVAELGWSKASGGPATAQLALAFAGGRLVAIDHATIQGGGMDAAVTANFAAAGKEELTKLEVQRLVVGNTNVTGSLSRRDEGGWRLQLSGASLDAAPLMDELQKAPASATAGPPLVIDAKLDHLLLGDKRAAQNVAGVLFSDGVHWQAASIDAAMAGGGKLRLRFGTVAGERKFNLTTDDFGGLLRLIDLTDNVRGGRFQLQGSAVDEGSRRVLKGRAEGTDYRLVGAPLFARLLSLASFSGIEALLRGEGIPFARLGADIVYGRQARLGVDNLRAYGGAIGVNASGSLDKQAGTIDVSGTLVPAYMLNSVLGNIPVLGNLLLGGAGEGIFGANFRVAGPLADPKLSVNPLSALAPGVLRRLFLFEPGNPSPVSSAAPGADTTQP